MIIGQMNGMWRRLPCQGAATACRDCRRVTGNMPCYCEHGAMSSSSACLSTSLFTCLHTCLWELCNTYMRLVHVYGRVQKFMHISIHMSRAVCVSYEHQKERHLVIQHTKRGSHGKHRRTRSDPNAHNFPGTMGVWRFVYVRTCVCACVHSCTPMYMHACVHMQERR